jgi:hypothetical protein
MMKRQTQRSIGALALALAAAAAVVGAAQAGHPSDRAGMLGVGGVAAEVAGDAAVVPNDRGGMLGVGSIESPSPVAHQRPDDRAGLHGPGMVVTAGSTQAPSVTVTNDGFRWGDAAFGAAAALGIVLLGTLAVVFVRQRSRMMLS